MPAQNHSLLYLARAFADGIHILPYGFGKSKNQRLTIQ